MNRPRGDRYSFRVLAQALRRACVRANRGRVNVPAGFVGPTLPPVPHIHPYQLRHLRAKEVAEAFGLEEVRAVLGHGAKSMSHHYAKAADAAIAARVAARAG